MPVGAYQLPIEIASQGDHNMGQSLTFLSQPNDRMESGVKRLTLSMRDLAESPLKRS
jgi:hypothetical protein